MRRGLPAFTLVGLPDRAVRESRERVRAALLNSGLDFPQQRLTVNLAPAHVRKAGPSFDLAIAVGVLAASGQVPQEPLGGCALCGELSLERRAAAGPRRARRGARRARRRATGACSCRSANAPEAALVDGRGGASAIPTLARIARPAARALAARAARAARRRAPTAGARRPDLADVRGQEDAKRALEIAAAGGHNLLMVGPPGAGKTMLARRLPGHPAAAELRRGARDHPGSTASPGIGDGRLAAERPFRAPHHTISAAGPRRRRQPARGRARSRSPTAACCSSTSSPEFARAALDALRQPLEDGRVDDHARPAHARVPGATRWWWPPATAARARGRADRCTLHARSSWRATCAASAARCSTGSTSSARWSRRRALELVGAGGPAARPRRRARARDRGARAPAARLGGQRRALQRRHGRPPHAPRRSRSTRR